MWNQRYDRSDYLFGTEPADFLRDQASVLHAGSDALFIADGEGRNSVYFAGLGHRVVAFDASDVGLEKARRLAKKSGVEVEFQLSDLFAWDWQGPSFDAVIGIFIQFLPPKERTQAFELMKQAIRPGGLILLHGYAPRQIEYKTGGPPDRANMYTLEMLRDAFEGFEIVRAEDYDRVISEGPAHSGLSALIDFVARKPG